MLFLDIDFLKFSDGANIDRAHTILFAVTLFCSLLNLLAAIVPLNCIANLQLMVNAQDERRRQDEERNRSAEGLNPSYSRVGDEVDLEQQRKVDQDYETMQKQYE